jgi:hypothetical protein
MSRRVTPSASPVFASLADAAEWHDAHDTAELEDSVEVSSPLAGRALSQVFSVRFDQATVAALTADAADRQIGVTQLVRAFVLEGLERDAAASADPKLTPLTDDAIAEIRSIVERVARQSRRSAS